MSLDIAYHKNGCGLTARCGECGKVVRRATGCNRSGLGYAEAGALADYEDHTKNCRCVWVYDENHDNWNTTCGHAFCFIDGGPNENHMKFCPYRGKKLKERKPK